VVGEEDCLSIDVVTLTSNFNLVKDLDVEARRTSEHLKPVIVLIHDGLETGGTTDEAETNAALSVSADSVVVTMNFRLGALGFLPVRAYPDGTTAAAPTAAGGAAAAPADAAATPTPVGGGAATMAASPTMQAGARRLAQDVEDYAPGSGITATTGAGGAGAGEGFGPEGEPGAPTAPTAVPSGGEPTVSSPTFAAPAGPGTGGLNGVQDIIVALHWVQRYIHNFGGNAAQVTVYGEGTGGHIACILGASPQAQNLFTAIAMSSGSCGGGLHTVGAASRNEDVLVAYMGVLGNNNTAALYDLSAAELTQGWAALRALNPLDDSTYLPIFWDDPLMTIDGFVLTEHPLLTYAAGRANMQRAMVGTNSLDTIFTQYQSVSVGRVEIPVQPDVSDLLGVPSSRQYFERRVENWVDANFAAFPQMPVETILARVLELYSVDNIRGANYQSSANMFLRLDSDAMYRCPSLLTAQIMSAATDVYSYVFAAGPYEEDPLVSLDLRSTDDDSSEGRAGYGSDRRNLRSLLCGQECFDLAVAGQLSDLTLLEVGYLKSLQVQQSYFPVVEFRVLTRKYCVCICHECFCPLHT